MVLREVYPETPVRVEYSLTEKGMALSPVIRELEKWASRYIEIDQLSQDEHGCNCSKG